jgi:predicted dehydrogenase
MGLANHANGLSLPASHWFWDQSKSGGIWIEHGVHFFDAFSWVSDALGEVLGSAAYARADGKIDRVEGLFKYKDVAAHCYHAFDQSGQTEQTTVHLTFEHGYLTLSEWVPTELIVQTTVPQTKWMDQVPLIIESSTRSDGQTLSRSTTGQDKSTLYRLAIQAGMRDLGQAIRTGQPPKVTGDHGLVSLITAIAAS